jgi:ketosteroid isomerase-like protein
MSTTQSVFEHHLQCFGTADLDGILGDYSENSALLTHAGAFKGRAAIRSFFEAAFAEFTKPGTTFDAGQSYVEGDCAFIVWSADTPDNRYEVASDTFLIRDGKIVVQTFAAKVTPKS